MIEKTEHLIAEARRNQCECSGDYCDAGLVRRLADALEAASTERAAVPDAATRELTEAIRLTVEYTGNDMLPAIEGWDWYDALVKYAPEVAQAFVDKPIHFPKPTDTEAERDAALAAIERVRALVEAWRYGMPEYTSSTYQEGQKDQQRKLVEQLLAALDGAPEWEWEYGYRSLYSKTLHMEDGARLKEVFTTQRTPDNWLPEMGDIYRRTKSVPAGPWLPVEGESNGS